MIRNSNGFAIACCLSVVTTACTSPGPTALSYTVRLVHGEDIGVLLDTAELALREQDYTIATRDDTLGTLIAYPLQTSGASGSIRYKGRLIPAHRLRRVAEIMLRPGSQTTSIFCRIVVQDQITETHRMFSLDRSGRDVPNTTPIERDAATTTEQNTVWRTLQRDKSAERAVLEAILLRTEEQPLQPLPKDSP